MQQRFSNSCKTTIIQNMIKVAVVAVVAVVIKVLQ